MDRLAIKYDCDFDDTNSNDPLTLMNERISDGCEILEIGAAHGRFTKYLVESRKCTVDIVEYNAYSGKDALKYSRNALLGEKNGDVEKDIWINKYKKYRYDYIVFADVLEHLYYPERVLEKCKKLLKKDGKILVSIPNICNKNIILSLLKNEFNYTSTGLLDNTHIRFFSKNNFLSMIRNLGYYETYIDATLGFMYSTEIDVKYEEFKDKNVDVVNTLSYGDVYQWVFEISMNQGATEEAYKNKFNSDGQTIFTSFGIPLINNKYMSENVIYPQQEFLNDVYTVKFDLTQYNIEGRFRFDPEDGSGCILEIISVDTDIEEYHIESSNVHECKSNKYTFFTDDPQIEVVGNFSGATYLVINYKIKMLPYKMLKTEISNLKKTNQSLSEANQSLSEANQSLSEANQSLNEANQTYIDENQNLKNIIEAIKNTRGYRLLEKFRKVRDTFMRCIYVIKSIDKYKIEKAIEVLKKDGIGAVMGKIDSYSDRYVESIDTNLLIYDTETYEHISLPTYNNPTVSIIIPVYNQWQYTYNCIRSIISNTENISYEVILADDVSSDETVNVTNYIDNVIVSRNNENLGFLRNCNNAANLAKGQYILFLNNDTNVQKKWLSSLLDLIESDKSIGMVGSKLVYPNGKLQEAGGILWNDGSAWNYGRGDDRNKPEYNYVRDVDYISGASIMIRKKLWEHIGGFDERYVPAYCEDSDLAFEVRKAGYRVVYQPASVVVHFEGISNGKDVNVGIKKYQVDNMDKFYNKWKEILEKEHYKNGENVFKARDRSRKKKTVIVIDHYVPHFDQDAGGRCTFSYLKLFTKMGLNVFFVGDNYFQHQPYTSYLQQMGIQVLAGDGWNFDKFKEWLKINGKEVDVFYLNRPHISIKYLGIIDQFSNAKKVYFDHDLHFLRLGREYELTGDEKIKQEAEEWKKKEFEIFNCVDAVHTAGIYEEEFLKNILPEKVIHSIPIYVYDKEGIVPIEENVIKGKSNIMFVGGFNHAPNVDAVVWFIRDIFPTIVKQKKDVKFFVVGSNVPDNLLSMANDKIIFTGYVSDTELEKYYRRSRVVVAPLRYGAGVKGKILESMAMGMPIVTTDIGAEGIPDINETILISNNNEEFAECVLKLLLDDELWLHYSRSEQSLIRKYFTLETAREIIKKDFDIK